jgi:Fe-S-cluster-containing dehydrogenase component/formate-dependent nitrite reductase membrane component NrfD
MDLASVPPDRPRSPTWAKVIDHTSCIGCHACTTACKSENEVPLSVTRTYVKNVDVGRFPDTTRAFQVTRCNQCDDAPCVTACPTSAMFKRRDGIVDFAKSVCIGCKACIAACPYDAIFINPEDHSAEKCNFCAHRIDMGLEPACVVVCPTESILIGDIGDPRSRVSQIVSGEGVAVRSPHKRTSPKVFYKGAREDTLDPLAAVRPSAGLFMWSEQGAGVAGRVVSGMPATRARGASAVLAYDVPHASPWGWKVSAYTWTKSMAAGAYLAILLLALGGAIPSSSVLWTMAAPLVSAACLAATGILLIADLKHPQRFYLIFTRPQWASWLVRGAVVLVGYGVVLAAHAAAGLSGATSLSWWLAPAGLPLAALTAAYTAFLFRQARARDLWQSALLPVHFLVQALVAGSAVMLFAAIRLDPTAVTPLGWLLAAATAAHLALVAAEVFREPETAHQRLAIWELTGGTFGSFFRVAALMAILSLAAPLTAWAAPVSAALALAGLLAYEHAYVQAGQIVPLA